MRALVVLIAFGVAVPAWAQIEERSSGASQWQQAAHPEPGCRWCVAAELGVAFATMLAGGAIGFGLNWPVHEPYGAPIWIGASLGLVLGSTLVAWVAGRYDDHPEYLGAFLGSLAGVIAGGGGGFLCFVFALSYFDFNGRNAGPFDLYALLGIAIVAVVPALAVTMGIELARSRRVSVGVAPLPGGGAAVLRAEF